MWTSRQWVASAPARPHSLQLSTHITRTGVHALVDSGRVRDGSVCVRAGMCFRGLRWRALVPAQMGEGVSPRPSAGGEGASPGPSADVEGVSPGASADGAGVRTDTLDGRLRFIGGGRDVGIFGVQGRVVTEYAANATCSDVTCSDATCSDATAMQHAAMQHAAMQHAAMQHQATMQGCNTSHAASSPVETSRKIECCECAGA